VSELREECERRREAAKKGNLKADLAGMLWEAVTVDAETMEARTRNLAIYYCGLAQVELMPDGHVHNYFAAGTYSGAHGGGVHSRCDCGATQLSGVLNKTTPPGGPTYEGTPMLRAKVTRVKIELNGPWPDGTFGDVLPVEDDAGKRVGDAIVESWHTPAEVEVIPRAEGPPTLTLRVEAPEQHPGPLNITGFAGPVRPGGPTRYPVE